MPKSAMVFPVQPGKDPRAGADLFNERPEEYRESRKRLGVTMERAYEMATPMGAFVIAYVEGDRPLTDTFGLLSQSDLDIDREFLRHIQDVHGVDMTQPPQSDPPEVLGDWVDESAGSARKRGLAFCAPVMPGAEDRGRAFAKEAWGARKDELAESRREKGLTREFVMLNHTPNGDVVCVYLEGDDPVEGNRKFAESSSEFDRWFRNECKSIFPPEVNFDEPLPPITQIFDSQEALVAS
ncbi:MAG: hypothetical protein JOZ46_01760 [Candidatus Dormibacteraeota bacterium]|nr:hypothetical protein [Candidatus Dormibacteraeota bacterium]MBV9524522.1 hypothetical protein [Candidatus Dormibacteraeota bacterium]